MNSGHEFGPWNLNGLAAKMTGKSCHHGRGLKTDPVNRPIWKWGAGWLSLFCALQYFYCNASNQGV